jgi:hypothetical protein
VSGCEGALLRGWHGRTHHRGQRARLQNDEPGPCACLRAAAMRQGGRSWIRSIERVTADQHKKDSSMCDVTVCDKIFGKKEDNFHFPIGDLALPLICDCLNADFQSREGRPFSWSFWEDNAVSVNSVLLTDMNSSRRRWQCAA